MSSQTREEEEKKKHQDQPTIETTAVVDDPATVEQLEPVAAVDQQPDQVPPAKDTVVDGQAAEDQAPPAQVDPADLEVTRERQLASKGWRQQAKLQRARAAHRLKAAEVKKEYQDQAAVIPIAAKVDPAPMAAVADPEPVAAVDQVHQVPRVHQPLSAGNTDVRGPREPSQLMAGYRLPNTQPARVETSRRHEVSHDQADRELLEDPAAFGADARRQYLADFDARVDALAG